MEKKVRVAIAGVGNCASSFVQGLEYYRDIAPDGIMTPDVGGYSVEDIEVVAAFDVNSLKVGKRLDTAIREYPNRTMSFASVPPSDVIVNLAPVLDGVGTYETLEFPVSIFYDEVEPYKIIKEAKADVLICYMPVGSEQAARYWADACLLAGCDFINAMPEFICTSKQWQDRFVKKGLRLAGDDIKSQVGATIVHRTLVNLFEMRGHKVLDSYQLNIGGNTDFENMLDRSRLTSKKISKTQAVTSQVQHPTSIGPSDFVPHLDDQKVAYININAEGFGGAPLEMEVKLKVHDSPNSAGVMMDAVRACKTAKDHGVVGYLEDVSSWCFKSPQTQKEDVQAYKDFVEWAM